MYTKQKERPPLYRSIFSAPNVQKQRETKHKMSLLNASMVRASALKERLRRRRFRPERPSTLVKRATAKDMVEAIREGIRISSLKQRGFFSFTVVPKTAEKLNTFVLYTKKFSRLGVTIASIVITVVSGGTVAVPLALTSLVTIAIDSLLSSFLIDTESGTVTISASNVTKSLGNLTVSMAGALVVSWGVKGATGISPDNVVGAALNSVFSGQIQSWFSETKVGRSLVLANIPDSDTKKKTAKRARALELRKKQEELFGNYFLTVRAQAGLISKTELKRLLYLRTLPFYKRVVASKWYTFEGGVAKLKEDLVSDRNLRVAALRTFRFMAKYGAKVALGTLALTSLLFVDWVAGAYIPGVGTVASIMSSLVGVTMQVAPKLFSVFTTLVLKAIGVGGPIIAYIGKKVGTSSLSWLVSTLAKDNRVVSLLATKAAAFLISKTPAQTWISSSVDSLLENGGGSGATTALLSGLVLSTVNPDSNLNLGIALLLGFTANKVIKKLGTGDSELARTIKSTEAFLTYSFLSPFLKTAGVLSLSSAVGGGTRAAFLSVAKTTDELADLIRDDTLRGSAGGTHAVAYYLNQGNPYRAFLAARNELGASLLEARAGTFGSSEEDRAFLSRWRGGLTSNDGEDIRVFVPGGSVDQDEIEQGYLLGVQKANMLARTAEDMVDFARANEDFVYTITKSGDQLRDAYTRILDTSKPFKGEFYSEFTDTRLSEVQAFLSNTVPKEGQLHTDYAAFYSLLSSKGKELATQGLDATLIDASTSLLPNGVALANFEVANAAALANLEGLSVSPDFLAETLRTKFVDANIRGYTAAVQDRLFKNGLAKGLDRETALASAADALGDVDLRKELGDLFSKELGTEEVEKNLQEIQVEQEKSLASWLRDAQQKKQERERAATLQHENEVRLARETEEKAAQETIDSIGRVGTHIEGELTKLRRGEEKLRQILPPSFFESLTHKDIERIERMTRVSSLAQTLVTTGVTTKADLARNLEGVIDGPSVSILLSNDFDPVHNFGHYQILDRVENYMRDVIPGFDLDCINQETYSAKCAGTSLLFQVKSLNMAITSAGTAAAIAASPLAIGASLTSLGLASIGSLASAGVGVGAALINYRDGLVSGGIDSVPNAALKAVLLNPKEVHEDLTELLTLGSSLVGGLAQDSVGILGAAFGREDDEAEARTLGLDLESRVLETLEAQGVERGTERYAELFDAEMDRNRLWDSYFEIKGGRDINQLSGEEKGHLASIGRQLDIFSERAETEEDNPLAEIWGAAVRTVGVSASSIRTATNAVFRGKDFLSFVLDAERWEKRGELPGLAEIIKGSRFSV